MLYSYMSHKSEILELEIPKEIVDHARGIGISIEKFRKTMEVFGTMQLASETSRLDKKRMEEISRKVKVASWSKTAKRLNL